jgi:hypothetical protein
MTELIIIGIGVGAGVILMSLICLGNILTNKEK